MGFCVRCFKQGFGGCVDSSGVWSVRLGSGMPRLCGLFSTTWAPLGCKIIMKPNIDI